MGTWKTRDGREIPIERLNDAHLANVIGFMERKYRAWSILAPMVLPYPRMQGEMAQLAAEEEWLERALSPIEKVYPVYAALVAERHRRLCDAHDEPGDWLDDEPSGGPV